MEQQLLMGQSIGIVLQLAIVLSQLTFLKDKSHITIVINAAQRLKYANSHFESFHFSYIIREKR